MIDQTKRLPNETLAQYEERLRRLADHAMKKLKEDVERVHGEQQKPA